MVSHDDCPWFSVIRLGSFAIAKAVGVTVALVRGCMCQL